MNEERVPQLKDIEEAFDTFLYRTDPYVVKLTLASVLGNMLPHRKPIWMMLVAPPSSGKTTTLNALLGLKVPGPKGQMKEPLVNISDLTTNSFASGMERSNKETSLLKRMEFGFVMVFKDFTSILSKNKDEKRIVMGQLREIYDGAYTKRTGNGNDVQWTGKVGAIAGVTESIYMHLESLSVMGDRFMLYQIDQPDRREMLKFKLRQESRGITEETQMPYARDLTHRYMQNAYSNLSDTEFKLPESAENDIIDVADFCTMVRSGVITNDYDGSIIFVPQAEMPARMFEQMMALAETLSYMNKLDNPELKEDNVLAEEDYKILYKVAYDSIPVTRRIALMYLAMYDQGVETSALATKTNYPDRVVEGWLEQLNALGVVKRVKKSSGFGNLWQLDYKYVSLLRRLQGYEAAGKTLEKDEDVSAEEFWEEEKW